MDEKKQKRRKALYAAILGSLFALACRALPAEYQGACEVIVKLCSGGL